MNVFSERLKNLRESLNYSKTKVASLVGVRLSTYANWEYGYNDPDMSMLIKLADLLDTTTDYLTGRTDDPKSGSKSQKSNTALTWEDLGMPMAYGGKVPDELRETYADLAQSYFKRHPEMLNKNK